jgi:DNA-binding PadR family transcriptional regulator
LEDRERFRKAFWGHGFKTGFLKLTLLKLISKGPSHGYALMNDIERFTEKDWKPSPGSIYPALQELESKGLIVSEKRGRQRVYSITEEGEMVLMEAASHLRMVLKHIRKIFSEEDL